MVGAALTAAVSLFGIGGSLGAQASTVAERPPAVYVDRGACPFEGCTYRTWTAKKPVLLLRAPGGAAAGIVVEKGEKVRAITGEVHVKPLRAVVRRKIQMGEVTLRPGDVLHLLTYVGEGAFKVWHRAEIHTMDVDLAWEGPRACYRSPEGCALEPEGGRDAFLAWARGGAAWWVKVERRSGKVGWTREVDAFEGKDALDGAPDDGAAP